MLPRFAANFRGLVSLRTLIALKLVVLAFALLGISGYLKFGDRPIEAQDKSAPTKAVDAKSDDGKPKTADSAAANGSAASTVSEKNRGGDSSSASSAAARSDDSGSTKRRSFLDGLLNLPSFDKGTAQREEISRFLDLAEQKQRQIQERILVLEKRETYLKELESAIESKVRALEDEKVLFQQSLQREKEISDERLTQLVEYYKKMEAKKAAPVMEKLDKDLVVKLIDKIPQKQVTLLLAAMSPERSVEITEYYGRVRSGKEYEMLKEMNQFLVDKFQDCKGMPRNAH